MNLTRRAFCRTSTAALLTGPGAFLPAASAGDATLHLRPTPPSPPARGPLRVLAENPRYFTDGSGRAVYLTGAHTWPNLVDQGLTDPPPRFDFDAYLKFLRGHGHNFVRLWTWESTCCDIDEGGRRMRYYAAPQPWARPGPGVALDRKPKFDLTRFDPAYFERLRTRVAAAGAQGIYVSIMLFEGWAMQHALGAWEGHPFQPANNVNGIDGDVNFDTRGLDIFTLTSPKTLALQEAYLRQVVATVNDLDNVLYEISNENHPPSTDWQYHLIRYLREQERARGRVHPIGMTFQYKGGRNQVLFDSPADWISPNPDGGYRDAPPPADGRKVILNDTDHLWGIGGSADWAWKSFLRGHQPLFMDPYDGVTFGAGPTARWDAIRRALGQTRRWAERVNLAALTPQPDLASTGYCLAHLTGPAPECLVYRSKDEPVRLKLDGRPRRWNVTWYDPATDALTPGAPVASADPLELTAPFQGPALLHLRAS